MTSESNFIRTSTSVTDLSDTATLAFDARSDIFPDHSKATSIAGQQSFTSQSYSGSAWRTVARTVRSVDAEKVKGCKEDIDTLLVFAGLFSAVLTAFLVESYKSLQPDTGSEIVLLLRHSLSRNYSVSPQFLNATSPLPPTPAFEAPSWALRVNGLWFASLICSLATASLGMLVKQWLREYLAMEYISPQEQLRAWQYRYPALGKWNVFEIATALPLLLQISLGLFFIGLCVFTAAVDERMGHSSLPLISAWAFFVILTTIAPLISPRCPFKVPLLKTVMKVGRRYIKFWMRTRIRLRLRDEEEDTIRKAEDDVQILLSVDKLLADDGLLDIMWEALRQDRPSVEDTFTFIRGILGHRLAQSPESAISLPSSHLQFPLDLRPISKRVWEMCMEIIALTLAEYRSQPALGKQTWNTPWTAEAFRLLLSKRAYPFPPSVVAVLTNESTLDNILGALLDASLTPSEVMDFLRSAAHARSPHSSAVFSETSVVSWQIVNAPSFTSAWRPFLGVTQRTLESYLEETRSQIPEPWVVDSALILLVNCGLGHLSDSDPSTLQNVLAIPPSTSPDGSDIYTVGRLLADRIRPAADSPFVQISSGLLFAVQRPDARSRLRLLNICHMYAILLDYEAGRQLQSQLPKSMWTFLERAHDLRDNQRAQVVLEDAWAFFSGYLSLCIDNPDSAPPTGLRGAFRVVLEFGNIDSRKRHMSKLLWRRLGTSKSPNMRRLWLSMLCPTRESRKGIVNIEIPATKQFVLEVFCSSEDWDMITGLNEALLEYADAPAKSREPYEFDPLQLCLFCLDVYSTINSALTAPSPTNQWIELWSTLSHVVSLYKAHTDGLSEQASSRRTKLATKCIVSIGIINSTNATPPKHESNVFEQLQTALRSFIQPDSTNTGHDSSQLVEQPLLQREVVVSQSQHAADGTRTPSAQSIAREEPMLIVPVDDAEAITADTAVDGRVSHSSTGDVALIDERNAEDLISEPDTTSREDDDEPTAEGRHDSPEARRSLQAEKDLIELADRTGYLLDDTDPFSTSDRKSDETPGEPNGSAGVRGEIYRELGAINFSKGPREGGDIELKLVNRDNDIT